MDLKFKRNTLSAGGLPPKFWCTGPRWSNCYVRNLFLPHQNGITHPFIFWYLFLHMVVKRLEPAQNLPDLFALPLQPQNYCKSTLGLLCLHKWHLECKSHIQTNAEHKGTKSNHCFYPGRRSQKRFVHTFHSNEKSSWNIHQVHWGFYLLDMFLLLMWCSGRGTFCFHAANVDRIRLKGLPQEVFRMINRPVAGFSHSANFTQFKAKDWNRGIIPEWIKTDRLWESSVMSIS